MVLIARCAAAPEARATDRERAVKPVPRSGTFGVPAGRDLVRRGLPRPWSFYIRDNGTGLQPSSLHRYDLILGRCPRLLWFAPSALKILTSDAKAV